MKKLTKLNFFKQKQEKLNQTSNSTLLASNKDQDMSDVEDKNSQMQEYSETESSNEKDDVFSGDEILEEVEEKQQQDFVLSSPQRNNDSIVSSIILGTPLCIGLPRKTYTDNLIIWEKYKKTPKGFEVSGHDPANLILKLHKNVCGQ